LPIQGGLQSTSRLCCDPVHIPRSRFIGVFSHFLEQLLYVGFVWHVTRRRAVLDVDAGDSVSRRHVARIGHHASDQAEQEFRARPESAHTNRGCGRRRQKQDRAATNVNAAHQAVTKRQS
jgi:hypothetical protein